MILTKNHPPVHFLFSFEKKTEILPLVDGPVGKYVDRKPDRRPSLRIDGVIKK